MSLEKFIFEEEWKPKFVVLPHLVKGNAIFGEPARTHFLRFNDFAPKGIGGKNVNLKQRRVVHEFEV